MDRRHGSHDARDVDSITAGRRDLRHARCAEIMHRMGVPITQCAPAVAARGATSATTAGGHYKQPIVLTNAMEGPAYGVALLAAWGQAYGEA